MYSRIKTHPVVSDYRTLGKKNSLGYPKYWLRDHREKEGTET